MKKIIKIIIITMILLMFSISMCFGTDNINLRVRIRTPRQYNEQALLNGYDNTTIYDNLNGSKLFELGSELSILMDSYYDNNYNFLGNSSNAAIGPYHVKLNGKYSAYDEALSEADNLNSNVCSGFYPYYDGNEYEIFFGAFTDESSANSKLSKYGLDGNVINGNKKNIAVYNGENDIVFMYSNNYNIYFTSENSDLSCNMIKIDSKPYRGMISFNIINDSTLISINKVDLESYLYGVVPCESSASWPTEALKAQTLTARTYAAANLNPNAYYGYDLEDNTTDQVYGGYSSEYEATNEAVNDTNGEMIYYDGKLIDAVFHSTSGGSTEDSENVWVNALPYLRGVEDEYSNVSPITEWNQSYTKQDIIDRLKLYGNNVSDLYSIEITEVSENNRVLECIFSTDVGEITYTKDKVRSVLGLKSLWFSIGNSSKYYFTNELYANSNTEVTSRGGVIDTIIDNNDGTIENSDKSTLDSGNISGKYIISSTGTESQSKNNLAFISKSGVSIINSSTSEYNISGRGWGHGVGMSQYGAMQMAKEGFTYEEILKYYYTGVNIKW